jgi:hypothetical protein
VSGDARDPFGERTRGTRARRRRVLGAEIEFRSASRELLALVDEAFAGGPVHRLPGAARLRIDLRLVEGGRRGPPGRMRLHAGAGFLHGGFDAENFTSILPQARRALVVVSRAMLENAHAVRYELIEFAALTLAARTQSLVPLHAACISRGGRGLLLLGDSGAGKSTLSLFAVLAGLRLVGEDNVFVAPATLAATGLSNYLHVRRDLAARVDGSARQVIERSDVIRRRSGVRKFAVDLRRWRGALAPRPQRLVGVVCLTPKRAGHGPLLARLTTARMLHTLRRTQAYGTSQPQWRRFERGLRDLPAFRLARGASIGESVRVLRGLLSTRA